MLEFRQLPPSSEDSPKLLTGSVISVTNQGFKGLQETIAQLFVVVSEKKQLSATVLFFSIHYIPVPLIHCTTYTYPIIC